MLAAEGQHDAKRALAQFFSTNAGYIFQGFPVPTSKTVIEPFAGRGDLIEWTRTIGFNGSIEAFDIMPQHPYITQQDTLRTPPSYVDKWVVTNPPFIARNKTTEHRDLYESYETNDLFKVFMLTLITNDGKPIALGGYVIIPLNFLCSVRPMDISCRAKFFNAYKLIRINLFEESVFDDTTCTVMAIWFEKATESSLKQTFKIYRYPTGDNKDFTLSAAHKWLIGGGVYGVITNPTIHISRYVKGMNLNETDQLTNLLFTAIDSGTAVGRIGLSYTPNSVYEGEATSRTYATLVIQGMPRLTSEQQKTLATQFNKLFEELRTEHWSLFLTNYRESKEYARKRAPFSLCYQLVNHILTLWNPIF